MKRGQLSLDLLFAVLLITVTLTNITYLATSEISHAESFDTITKVKLFSSTLVDHTAKVYAIGEGYKIREVAPDLNGGTIRIIFDGTTNRIIVNATVNGRSFWITKNSTVPLYDSAVTLNSGEKFWLVAYYNETEGMLYVKVEK
ncbi:hypothetical protein E3E31_10595 [Thermococcus sp. M39]|uniref:hypothetical protein n=1 Tax=unclassified Thermococcus TaxID=2627626 RepID=UPI00143C78E0|nr:MULTISPECIES: hypothetical protein [unclassified Thermococcus]NJE08962.1 hypothetical protein [Thermococcus sp. M39]NJE12764.1 hypothetical protein [Thermococcus sp. LS2]